MLPGFISEAQQWDIAFSDWPAHRRLQVSVPLVLRNSTVRITNLCFYGYLLEGKTRYVASLNRAHSILTVNHGPVLLLIESYKLSTVFSLTYRSRQKRRRNVANQPISNAIIRIQSPLLSLRSNKRFFSWRAHSRLLNLHYSDRNPSFARFPLGLMMMINFYIMV